MHLLNLGILAHVDAGKTSLTERLLHSAGIIDEIGSVDAGSTQTDTLALERQRGITIKSAVVSFPVDDITVNLLDTPGHPDFIAEVERVLGVLDGAVLVVSAVEGVQAQTRVLMRTLRRLRIPTLVFVNKIDRRGARQEGVLRELSGRLSAPVVPMGTATGLGTRQAAFRPGRPAPDVLADHDDDLLTAYVDGSLTPERLHAALVAQTRAGLVHPVYFGSAMTGAGVPELIAGIKELLPPADGDPEGPLSGTVFKVERGPAGEKIAYARLFSGTLRTRDRVLFGGREGKVTAISVFDHGTDVRDEAVAAGLKAMYQALDSRVKGASWWTTPATSGPVLSGNQWQWDIYNGRHHELMNGNPDKVLTTGDAWNDEDLSAVRLDDTGKVTLRQDARLLDRIYPSATSGTTLAFTYEDRSRDGSTTLTWNPVPSSLPNVAQLVGSGQYGLLVWRSNGGSAPTELHLPATFPTASTTVVSDLGTVYGPPAYTTTTKIAAALEPGGTGSRRLLLSAPDAGTVHYALVTNGATAPTATLLAAARSELSAWVAQKIK
ncbi:Elongation factor G, mitochondrial [Streptomyces aurantiogriseus]